MPTQPTILAAVDLDRHAVPVIAQAARLAALCQGHLAVVHVVDGPGGYEPDQPFTQCPGEVLAAMVRHARAYLVGMVSHLDLPTAWVEIRVETGPITQTLADIVGALQPRYCLVGSARLGLLSPSAGFAEAIKGRSDCELLAVQGKPGGEGGGILPWVRNWLAGGPDRVDIRRARSMPQPRRGSSEDQASGRGVSNQGHISRQDQAQQGHR